MSANLEPGLTELEQSKHRGLKFLARRQQADGGFVSYSGTLAGETQAFRRSSARRTTFVPALMLASLSGLDDSAAAKIRRGLAGFLLKQRSPGWSFNYWAAGTPERKSRPYPDDLDDTFCALAGLYLYDPGLVDGSAMAQAVKLLLAAEAAVGGPYRTWLVPPSSDPVWMDIDTAVNANVAFFLGLTGNRLPALDSLMEKVIAAGQFGSPYYPSAYPVIYYLARAYDGDSRDRLLKEIRRLQKQALSPLDTALSISSGLRVGETRPLAGEIRSLLAKQRSDGSWAAGTFCADPSQKGKRYYHGAAALTTTFVLEALALYSGSISPPRSRFEHTLHNEPQQAALKLARRQCRELDPVLRRTVRRSLTKLAMGDDGAEIAGLAVLFNQSLLEPLKDRDELLNELGAANLYGWLAYTVYDDVMDGEDKSGLLPAANAALRRSLDGFSNAALDSPSFRILARRIFDTIDGANAWEWSSCRCQVRGDRLKVAGLPDYDDLSRLAERSLGHVLAPLAVLEAAGIAAVGSSGPANRILSAFKHYLIARQLHDDAHDWADDLSHGRITPVVAGILQGMGAIDGTYSLTGLLADGRRQFWHRTLTGLCRTMERHLASSRRDLISSGLLRDTNALYALLDRLGKSIEDTASQQRQARDFLQYYTRKAPVEKARP